MKPIKPQAYNWKELKPQPHAPRGPLVQKDPITSGDLITGQCRAKAKHSGKPCRYPAIPGGTVCRFHGGGAPQVKAAAMDRLRALQNPAIDRMAQLIEQKEFPTVSYAASRDVLDRTLGKPGEHLDVTIGAADELMSRLDRGRLRAARKP
jgi:hypothetical protein